VRDSAESAQLPTIPLINIESLVLFGAMGAIRFIESRIEEEYDARE